MKSLRSRLSVAGFFGLLCVILSNFLPPSGMGIESSVALFLLGSCLAYATWPRVERASSMRGSSLKLSFPRVLGALAGSVLIGTTFSMTLWIFQGGTIAVSQVLAAHLWFAVISYLVWPSLGKRLNQKP